MTGGWAVVGLEVLGLLGTRYGVVSLFHSSVGKIVGVDLLDFVI